MVKKVTEEDLQDDFEDLEDINLEDDLEEKIEDDDIDLDDLDDLEDELEEEKAASFGVHASMPDPIKKGASKKSGDTTNPPQGSSLPKTKTSMLTTVMAKLHSMPKTELTAAYKTLMGPKNGEGIILQGSSKLKEALELTANDFDLSEDVNALFEGADDLSEDFKNKAITIFEAAVSSKVTQRIEALQEQVEDLYDGMVAEIEEELTEKLDSYLDYVVEQWIENNALSIDAGIRTEIAEDFMVGLKNLFVENYIDVPEDRVDLLDELSNKIDDLEEELNSTIDKNVMLEEKIDLLNSELIIDQMVENMTLTDAEKLKELAANIDFIDEENFIEKLEILKESYFGDETDGTSQRLPEASLELTEEINTPSLEPNMKAYLSAISRTSTSKT